MTGDSVVHHGDEGAGECARRHGLEPWTETRPHEASMFNGDRRRTRRCGGGSRGRPDRSLHAAVAREELELVGRWAWRRTPSRRRRHLHVAAAAAVQPSRTRESSSSVQPPRSGSVHALSRRSRSCSVHADARERPASGGATAAEPRGGDGDGILARRRPRTQPATRLAGDASGSFHATQPATAAQRKERLAGDVWIRRSIGQEKKEKLKKIKN